MAKEKTEKKCRNLMYEQQIRHLPDGIETLQDMYALIADRLSPSMVAGILHDKDYKEDGVTLVEPHIHIMMRFDNARSHVAVAKAIGDKPQQMTIWRGDYKNGFSYLIHATDGARALHQYDANEVISNFDYISFITDIGRKIEKNESIRKNKRIELMLNLVATGELALRDAIEELTGAEYAKSSIQLKKAHEKFLIRSADELRNEMIKYSKAIEAYWIYGSTGTGKSRLAKFISEKEDQFYITTTQKDPFEFYQGEPIIVLDELRPEAIPYSELLAILDPFSFGFVRASSRYSNKELACRMFIITTPFEPTSFYSAYNLKASDSGEQLYRRLTTVLKMSMDKIYKMEYDRNIGMYLPVSEKENVYSVHDEDIIQGRDLFDMI